MIRETASIILAALDVLAVWFAVLFVLMVVWVAACERNVRREQERVRKLNAAAEFERRLIRAEGERQEALRCRGGVLR